MSYTTIWTYVWDIVDDGVEDVLSCIKNEVGLDAISVATSYHSVGHLRPHTKGQRIFTSHDSAVYFKPDDSFYKHTYIKPNVSPILGDGNPLREISDVSDKIGLNLISWTVCIHNTWMGRAYPQTAFRNVFGDVYHAYPCPSNPATQEYLLALTKDLTFNYNMYAIEVESLSFGGFGHFHTHSKIGFDLGSAGMHLLSLCFCPSCIERGKVAGIDVDAIINEVKNYLLEAFSSGSPVTGDIASTIDGLSEYLKVRETTMTNLIKTLKSEIASQLFFMSMGDVGIDAKEVGAIADRVETLCYMPDPDGVENGIKAIAERFGCDISKVTVGLQAYPPASPDGQTLEQNVHRALNVGVEGFSFYNYGVMPKKCLDWVKNATDIITSDNA